MELEMLEAIGVRRLTKVFKIGRGLPELLVGRNRRGRRIKALDGVDLSIRTGEKFCILGPNGAGKTTLMKTLAGLVVPDQGTIQILGYDLAREPGPARAATSLLISEERSFYWRLTGRQNLEFFAALYDLPQGEVRERIRRAAEKFEIEDLDKLYQEYSTGNKNRLALARSVLLDARLILMDEPTRSLDPKASAALRLLLKDLLQDGSRTLVFTTHDTREAEALADRIAILDHGVIRACGTLQELRSRIQSREASLEEIFCRVAGAENLNVS